MNFSELLFSTSFVYSIIRLTTPIIFAMLSAVISIKSGVVNIAIEGIMLITALSSAIISAYTHSVGLTFLSAVVIGGSIGVIFILLVMRMKANPILTAIAINIIATGGTVFFLWFFTGDKSTTTSLASLKSPYIDIPFVENIPVLGDILSGHNLLTYIAVGCIVFLHILLYKTSLGLRIRAVGEDEGSAKSVGINVDNTRLIAQFLSGAFAGLGGAYMSMAYLSWFSANMVAGRGFIGLATEAMGGGTPFGGFIVSLFFGLADATANLLQTQVDVPSELIQMMPYVATIIGLVSVNYYKKKVKPKKSSEG